GERTGLLLGADQEQHERQQQPRADRDREPFEHAAEGDLLRPLALAPAPAPAAATPAVVAAVGPRHDDVLFTAQAREEPAGGGAIDGVRRRAGAATVVGHGPHIVTACRRET